MRLLARLHRLAFKAWRRLLMRLYRPLFASHGRGVWFDPYGCYTYETISVGNHVFLGLRPTLVASESRIRIGDKVMFGPGVMIIGGNHNVSVAGRFMCDVTEKRPEDDRDVVIDDDVWVGARAVILQGVAIGRGAVVGAGSVVTRSVPPYAVVVGAPARVMKYRWNVDTILRHEAALYPPERRLSRDALMSAQGDVKPNATTGNTNCRELCA